MTDNKLILLDGKREKNIRNGGILFALGASAGYRMAKAEQRKETDKEQIYKDTLRECIKTGALCFEYYRRHWK